MLNDLQLVPILQTWGEPHLIGSLAMGLMVVRDIDFNVLVPHVDAEIFHTAYLAIAPIAVHPRVFRLQYVSQAGPFNPDGPVSGRASTVASTVERRPANHGRLTCGRCNRCVPRSRSGMRVRRGLTPEMRVAILAIKREMKSNLQFEAVGIRSRHVYQAALSGV